jgi:hypothetical protein
MFISTELIEMGYLEKKCWGWGLQTLEKFRTLIFARKDELTWRFRIRVHGWRVTEKEKFLSTGKYDVRVKFWPFLALPMVIRCEKYEKESKVDEMLLE